MDDTPACAICGSPFEGTRCPVCGSRWTAPTLHRHLTLLVLLIAIAAGAFVVTRAVAGRARELHQLDGQFLFERAEAALDAGRTAAAVVDFRRAAATDPASRSYRLALARALIADGDRGEARSLLEGLRAERPDDVDVSLELARLEAATDRWVEALQHYQHTLAALWSADQLEARRQIRTELIERLLARRDRRRALSELLILSATLPEDAATQTAVGRMYLDAGDPVRAQEHFETALAADPASPGALAGAGEAAFAQHDYVRARLLLAEAPATVPRVAELRELSALVLDLDPLAPRVTLAERRRRTAAIVEHVRPGLERCLEALDAPPGPAREGLSAAAETLDALAGASGGTGLLRLSRDEVGEVFEAAFRAQTAVVRACGAATPMDRAVLLIGARHEFD